MKWLEMLHSGSLEYGKSVQYFFLHEIKLPYRDGIDSAISDNVRPPLI